MNPQSVRIVPLGGLGEVGMNCLALEQTDGILVVDCGIRFPDADLGVELLHPDFTYLLERRNQVVGVFLTHGHEDHVGALPYLLRELSVPVWGPAHALKLALRRVRQRGLPQAQTDFRVVKAGRIYPVGPFVVEPIQVSHSIVEATALRIETRGGVVLHTGDFKFDGTPPDGKPTDEARLSELGDRGIDLLLSDSTNVDSPKHSGSEAQVAEALEDVVARAPGRVVVGMFSSNVQRLISLGGIAERTGRRIGTLGRGLRTHVEMAHDLGHLAWSSTIRLLPDAIARTPPRQSLILAGGTQGEPNSALARLARAEHPALALDGGDSVLLSSRVIPGNELRVSELTSQLLRLGVQLHSRNNCPSIHVSGHASLEELERMLMLTRPRAFIPVHGTLRHMMAHADLAALCGVSQRLVLENGQTAQLDASGLERLSPVGSGRVSVDRAHHVLAPAALQARAHVGRSGLVQLSLLVDSKGQLRAEARLSVVGVVGLESAAARGELVAEAERALGKYSVNWKKEGLNVEERLAGYLTVRLERRLGVRPYVKAHVLTV